MPIYETGINLGNRNLIQIKYYSSPEQLDPNLRAGFLQALDGFSHEVMGDDIATISLASFKLVCVSIPLALPGVATPEDTLPLISYAIIDKKLAVEIVKEQLIQVSNRFTNRYSINDIFSKKPKYFKKFISLFDEILGDLKLKEEDRFRSIL
ncbi:hypothetical protein ES706_03533 [subsurface metagenome]